MKKIIITLSLTAMLVFSLQAQTINYSVYEEGFEDFAAEVAKSLPFNAAIGLNWSDAYIGSFPHFGVGLTVGATSVPYDAMKPVFDVLSADLGSELDFLETWGAPFPAYSLEARVGGLILPFDAGIKLGILPDDAKVLMPFNMDYLMLGADVRYRVLKSRGPLPEISFGVGYTMLNGGVTLPGILGGDQLIDLNVDGDASGQNDWVKLTDPDLNFNWQSHVIDFKIQASKKLLVITPHVGLGLAYGTSSAGGGAETDVWYSTDNGGSYPTKITQAQIDAVIAAFEALGQTPPDLTTGGLLVESDTKGWAMRAFGGLSLNLLLLKFDLSAMYNFTSSSLGVALNTRIQL
ncbi:MAG: hypothetical protein GH155_02740 [Spirochaeta sp.]|nr:hypothetical protein [Spirochaeta sp.]